MGTKNMCQLKLSILSEKNLASVQSLRYSFPVHHHHIMIVTASCSHYAINSHAIKGKFHNFLLCTGRGSDRKNKECFVFSKGVQTPMNRQEASNAIRYARK